MNKDGSPRGHWIKVARRNGISRQVYNNRVYRQHWEPQRAATMPIATSRYRSPVSISDDALMLELRNGGMSIDEIANKFDIHAQSVNQAIDRARIRNEESVRAAMIAAGGCDE